MIVLQVSTRIRNPQLSRQTLLQVLRPLRTSPWNIIHVILLLQVFVIIRRHHNVLLVFFVLVDAVLVRRGVVRRSQHLLLAHLAQFPVAVIDGGRRRGAVASVQFFVSQFDIAHGEVAERGPAGKVLVVAEVVRVCGVLVYIHVAV